MIDEILEWVTVWCNKHKQPGDQTHYSLTHYFQYLQGFHSYSDLTGSLQEQPSGTSVHSCSTKSHQLGASCAPVRVPPTVRLIRGLCGLLWWSDLHSLHCPFFLSHPPGIYLLTRSQKHSWYSKMTPKTRVAKHF